MNIGDIVTTFEDLLRPNYFEVIIEPPAQISLYEQPILKFLVLSTDFPFETIEPTTYVSSSQKRKFANDISFGNLPITFRLDSHGRILEFFQRWRNLVVSDEHRMGYYEDYIGSIYIKMLNRQKQEVYTAKLTECFPVNRSNINLSHDTNDQISTLTVTFEYMLVEYSHNGSYVSSSGFDMLTGQGDQFKLPFDLIGKLPDMLQDKLNTILRDGQSNIDKIKLPLEDMSRKLSSTINKKIDNQIRKPINDVSSQLGNKIDNQIKKPIRKFADKITSRLPKIKF